MAENNNFITRNLRQNGSLPYKTVIKEGLLNNEMLADGYYGVQGAVREIFHRGVASACIITESTTGNLAPSGTYASCNVANGYIMTRNSDGRSRLVLCAAVTALNIDAVTKCVVASNDGVVSVKAKTSVLATDVIIAIRGSGDNALVDVRNLKTEDDTLLANIVCATARPTLLVPNLVGRDSDGYRMIILKSGDSISSAITTLAGKGIIVLLPGTYTGNITITHTGTRIVGSGRLNTTIAGAITLANGDFTLEGVTVASIDKNTVVTYDPGTIIIKDCAISPASSTVAIDFEPTSISANKWYLYIMNTIINTTSATAIRFGDGNASKANLSITNSYIKCTTAGAPILRNLSSYTDSVYVHDCYIEGSKNTGDYVMAIIGGGTKSIKNNVFVLTNKMCALQIDGGGNGAGIQVCGNQFTVIDTEDGSYVMSFNLSDWVILSENIINISGAYSMTYAVGGATNMYCHGNVVYYNPGAAKTCTTGLSCYIATGNRVYKGGSSAGMTTPINASKGKSGNDLDGTWTA